MKILRHLSKRSERPFQAIFVAVRDMERLLRPFNRSPNLMAKKGVDSPESDGYAGKCRKHTRLIKPYRICDNHLEGGGWRTRKKRQGRLEERSLWSPKP